MDSIYWSKQYVVFSLSRLDLQHLLGFSQEEITRLSNYNMQRIAEEVRESYSHLENDFWETVRFVTSVELSETSDPANPATKEQASDGTLDRGA